MCRRIEGIDHPKVLGYLDVLRHNKPVGKSVAIIGAGGIGFDVGEFLSHPGRASEQEADARGGMAPGVGRGRSL